ncbi:hypothetical protein HKW98_08925 [Stutzerimonas urumqiensis]|uniref:hypothetical protein n=1 Tax=Stutzerimonas urumqiensis TaxID=638269 RepID=UPI003BAD138F
MTDPTFLSGIHLETWRELVDGVAGSRTKLELREALGRAEGYARGLFESGRIAKTQREELCKGVSSAALTRVEGLPG